MVISDEQAFETASRSCLQLGLKRHTAAAFIAGGLSGTRTRDSNWQLPHRHQYFRWEPRACALRIKAGGPASISVGKEARFAALQWAARGHQGGHPPDVASPGATPDLALPNALFHAFNGSPHTREGALLWGGLPICRQFAVGLVRVRRVTAEGKCFLEHHSGSRAQPCCQTVLFPRPCAHHVPKNGLSTKPLCVMPQVVFHKRGDEVVAVVVFRVAPQRQGLADGCAGGFKQMGLQLGLQNFIP